MNSRALSFLLICVSVLLIACKPSVRKGHDIFAANQALFDAMIRTIYRENPNFIAPDARATELNVFDFDHTLANTETMIPIRDASDKVTARRDSKCFFVRKGESADFSVFTRDRLMAGNPIAFVMERARVAGRAANELVFIVTARGQSHTFQSAHEYLRKRGVRVNGVIAVNSPLVRDNLWKKLRLPAGMNKLPGGMKKPLLIAALIEHARERNAKIKTVRYYEDTDKYIGGYIQFMSRTYPKITAEVRDYIRSGKPNQRTYREKLVARVQDGKARDEHGKTVSNPSAYDSGDCPPPPQP